VVAGTAGCGAVEGGEMRWVGEMSGRDEVGWVVGLAQAWLVELGM
jgi:hypothetical protein